MEPYDFIKTHKEMLLGRYLRSQAPYLASRSMYSTVRVTCPANIGDKLHAVETPALVVRRDALHRNMQRMKDYVDSLDRPVLLRPHTKTHKCPALAKLQIEEYGAVGVCCQKLDEAEPMVKSGVTDILLTNSFVGEKKIERLCQLAKKAKLSVVVDSIKNIMDIREGARKHGVTLNVLIEVNGGQQRCGINVHDGLGGTDLCVSLAREIIDSGPELTFKGIHCYGGFLQHIRSADERRARVLAEPVAAARVAVDGLLSAGILCEVVTGAGTGSYKTEVEGSVHNELQPGSYCFMDADYGNNSDGYDVFENALFIHSTVISKSVDSETRAVLDAGLKAISLDSGPPQAIEGFIDGTRKLADVEFLNGGDEHGILSGRVAHLQVGDTVRLIPGHIDPTVNMHQFLVVVDTDEKDPSGEPIVVDVWDISGRSPGF